MAGEASRKRLVDEWNMECMRSILPVIRSETTFFLKEEKYCMIRQIWISLEKGAGGGVVSQIVSQNIWNLLLDTIGTSEEERKKRDIILF